VFARLNKIIFLLFFLSGFCGFVLLLLYEGLPKVLLEAMAVGAIEQWADKNVLKYQKEFKNLIQG
jgi:hypothetical protein